MKRRRFRDRTTNYRPLALLQQLEERIVLDASVSPANDNQDGNPDGQTNPSQGSPALPGDAATSPGAADAGGNAGLAPELPDSFEQVFNQDLNVVLIANNLADVQTISQAAASPYAKVIVYDAQADNLSTITSKLQDIVNSTGHKIDNLAIVGHGTPGNLTVGTDQIQFFSLGNYSATFEALGQTLTEDAQIQFYGCSIAGDPTGQAMFDSIAVYTTADTFASTDTTGGNAHDWTLEYSSNASVAMHTLLNTDALAADNTPLAAPVLVTDIDSSAGSSATSFVQMGGKTYFVASDGLHQGNIWVYDPAGAGTTTLLQANVGTYSSATKLTVVGSQLFFSATDNQAHGTELWVTDGTNAGTHMVKDIAPNSSGTPENLIAFNGKLFFSASTTFDAPSGAVVNKELWQSDGTEAGTKLVKEINPLTSGTTSGSNPGSFTVMDNTLFFWANDGTNNGELWKSTPNGGVDNLATTDVDESYTTQMVADIYVGGSGSPSNLTVFNDGVHGNKLYFTATNATYGRELWSTDGTSANTVMVKDILPGTGHGLSLTGSSAQLTVVDNGVAGSARLYFVAIYDGTGFNQHGYEVWSTASSGLVDDVATTTVDESMTTALVRDVNTNVAPPGTTTPTNLIAFNHKLYFTETDGTGTGQHGLELWSTDGTFAGTTLVQDIYAGTFSSNPSNLTVFNGKLYFTATDGTAAGLHGTELWATDGTTTGVVLDINVGTGSSSPSNLTVSGGKLYFSASDGTTAGLHGQELWATDGTTTAMVKDINPGTASGSPTGLKDIGGKIAFTANNGLTGSEPWVSDGTDLGTTLLADLNLGGGSVQWFTNLNGTLYFAASDPVHGLELWKSDGTAAGTTMVMDLNPGINSGVSSYGTSVPLAVVNGTLFFLGNTSTGTDSALYKIDNATGLPVLVKNVIPGYVDWLINFTAFQDTLYFTNYDAGNYYLWRSDGTAAGTVAVTDPSGAQIKGTSTPYFTEVNGTLFFQSGQNGFTINGSELYKIDANGNQVMVQDLATGNYVGSSPSNLTNVGGTLYFTASVGGVTGLYSSNGTTISPVANALGVTTIANLTNLNGTLLFTGTTAATGNELYMVNNATGSIELAADVASGTTGGSPTNLYNANGTLYFSAADPTNGKEVWTYTTASGASLLKDINPGTGASFFTSNSFIYLDGLTYFKATDGTTGDELWQTNGTTAGTVSLGDIYPGINGSNPANLIGINNTLFFSASGVSSPLGSPSGTELWKVDGAGTNTVPTATLMSQTNTIDEDSPAFSLQDIVVTDPDAGDIITATLTLNNTAAGILSANNGASYNAGTGFWSVSGTVDQVNTALANVAFTPTADWNGTVGITTHVQDAHATGPSNGLVTINVTSMNDAPTVVPQTVNLDEDPAAAVAIVLSGNPGPANEQAQTLTYVLGDLSGIHGKLYSDAAGTLELLSGAMLTAGAAGQTTLTVYYVPDADYNGGVSFTYSASDDGGAPVQGTTTPAAVTINIAAVNDAPVNTVPLSAVADTNALTPITGISISDVDAGTSAVQVTLSVVSGTLQVNDTVVGGLTAAGIVGNASGSVVLTGTLAEINATLADATGLRYLSNLNYVGPDTLTVSTDDLGATGTPGALTDSDPVAITVSLADVNDPPVINLSGVAQQTDSSGAVLFNLANGNLISISDIDAGTGLLKVTLTATHGTMTLSGVTGLTFDPGLGDGTADATMTFSGTLTDINNALDGMTFSHDAGYYGMADVTVNVNDQGNTGPGGPQSVTNVAAMSVEPYDVWFTGFGTETGWEVYNHAATNISYYTHDYAVYWQHVNSTDTWNFYDGSAWYATAGLDMTPVDLWFHGFGTYAGWEVYNHAATNISYYTHDYAVYWQHVTSTDTWNFFDGSVWYAAAGLGATPVDVWFHGFGTDAGWDVFNHAAFNVSYYTQDYAVYWQHMTSTDTWNFYDGSVWYAAAGLGATPVDLWFHGFGTDAGWDVYNHAATNVSYYTHDYAVYWQHVNSTNTWNFYDGSVWYATAGLGATPVDLWFNGFGTYAGWDVFDHAATNISYYTQNYTVYWQHVTSSDAWNYYNGTVWAPTTGLGVVV